MLVPLPAASIAALFASLAGAATAQTNWFLAAPPNSDGPLVHDPVRQRTLLSGAASGNLAGAPFSATWAWNGTDWQRLITAGSPPARTRHSLSWHAASGKVLLFGGTDGAAPLGDTWLFDGSEWSEAMPAHSPPARHGHAAAPVPTRQTVLLFGGFGSTTTLDDTWEWDGADWVATAPTTRPISRHEHGMAYDPLRDRVVLYGGRSGNGTTYLRDTFEHDGTTWAQVGASGPNGAPLRGLVFDGNRNEVLLLVSSATFLPAETWTWNGTVWTRRSTNGPTLPIGVNGMAYDAARGRAVIGSQSGLDTWEWNGSSWSLASPAMPRWRSGFAISHHDTTGDIVLFGGFQVGVDETWLLRGGRWIRHLGVGPAGRNLAAMVDDRRGNLVLFGGAAATSQAQPLGDTWLWNGAAWTQATPAASPSARLRHAMAYDPLRQRTVLFGGSGTAGPTNDTWEFDGTGWLQRMPQNSPPAWMSVRMVCDERRGECLLLANPFDLATPNQTWTWDGVDWTQRAPTTVPPAFIGDAMVYDRDRDRVVHFGGTGHAPIEATHEWDGSDWVRVNTPTWPERRAGHGMVYDRRARQVVVVFGARNQFGVEKRFSDVWYYGRRAAWAAFGSGCSGSLGVPQLQPITNALPETGRSFACELSRLPQDVALVAAGFSNSQSGSVALPLPLAPLGMPGCSLLVDPIATDVVLGSNRIATWRLSIPRTSGLLGTTFFHQGFALDPGANAAGATVTNGGQAVIGL